MHDFDEDASIDLTPVIDVIFMLLIFSHHDHDISQAGAGISCFRPRRRRRNPAVRMRNW